MTGGEWEQRIEEASVAAWRLAVVGGFLLVELFGVPLLLVLLVVVPALLVVTGVALGLTRRPPGLEEA